MGCARPPRPSFRAVSSCLRIPGRERLPDSLLWLGCGSQTARTAIERFNEGGLDEGRAERRHQMPHRSLRGFGKAMSLWTLDLAAEMSFEQGLPNSG
jgi:hypothetical protein